VLSVRNECRELLFLLEKDYTGEAEIHCAELAEGSEVSFTFNYREEHDADYIFSPIGNYIYDPNAALTKAGAFRLLCRRYGCGKLHANTHVYTSEKSVQGFPGRAFKVRTVLPYDTGLIREQIGNGKASLVFRNFPVAAEEAEKKLKLKSDSTTYIFLVKDHHEHLRAVICERIS
jgi:hypothetical protein